MDPLIVQQPPNISSDGFSNVTSPAESISLTFNLTGLSIFTNYSMHMTVSAYSVGNAPIEVEILTRTNTTGEYRHVAWSYSVNIIMHSNCNLQR